MSVALLLLLSIFAGFFLGRLKCNLAAALATSVVISFLTQLFGYLLTKTFDPLVLVALVSGTFISLVVVLVVKKLAQAG